MNKNNNQTALNKANNEFSTGKNLQVRRLRAKAHDLAAKIWGEWDDPNTDKASMYQWLKKHSFSEHIGDMSLSELRYVISKLKKFKSQQNGMVKRLKRKGKV